MWKVKDIKYDKEDYPGCETCDYGSRYVDDFIFIFEDEETKTIEKDHYKIEAMYDHLVSEADLMMICLNYTDRDDLARDIIELIEKKYKTTTDCTSIHLYLNEKEILLDE